MTDEFSKLIEQSFEKQGVKMINSENVKTKSGKDGKIYVVSFKAKSKDGKQEYEYERLMFFTGDLSQTIWIEANYPTVVKKILYDVLKSSLLTVQF
jgi:pyruvate/2-oxoglutarate dehydrogenase complex dihydrolipoamide dehydrogenase (E3) component